MQRLLEMMFGIDRAEFPPGVEPKLEFNPPSWMTAAGGAAVWNTLLVLAALAIVVVIYRRDGRRRGPRILLGGLRVLLLVFVITLLNRPVFRKNIEIHRPSVVAVLIDDSQSMLYHDTDGVDGGDLLALSRARQSLRGTTQPSTKPAGPTSQPVLATDPLGEPESEPVFGTPGVPSRLDVAQGLLLADEQKALLRQLASKHAIRVFRFSSNAQQIGSVDAPDPLTKAPANIDPTLVTAVRNLVPEGAQTNLVASLSNAMDSLRSERLAGVVVITDAREIPGQAPLPQLRELVARNVNVYGVLVGKPRLDVKDVGITYLNVQESAFKGDIVQAKVGVKSTGYGPGKHRVNLRLFDRKTKEPLRTEDGQEARKDAEVSGDGVTEVEVPFFVKEIGSLDVVARIEPLADERDKNDNWALETVQVLDTKINVLYVDGYPRWEYRYIKNELIRDKTINISCLLTSADTYFAQEGDPPDPNFGPNDPRTGSKFIGPITKFPENADDLRKWDVVIFGDVDPRQFTDFQLKMVSDFVSNEAGGFAMIAGPRFAPREYRGSTFIEPILPVNLTSARPMQDEFALFNRPFSPELTEEGRRGEAATIFRFFPDKEKNDEYIKKELPKLFWFYWGVTEKTGASKVYAVHETLTGPDGQKAPLLVLGRFGAGRTLFSAVDDSWRWRYFTGESVFDTYWVQQIRYLARGRKLAERGFRFAVQQRSVERGGMVRINLNLLDPKLRERYAGGSSTTRPSEPLFVEVVDAAGTVVRKVELTKEDAVGNLFTGAFEAQDEQGNFTVRLPKLAENLEPASRQFRVERPAQELETPTSDPAAMARVAGIPQSAGDAATRPAAPSTKPTGTYAERVMNPVEAQARLVSMIPDMSEKFIKPQDKLIWDKWPCLAIFMLLLTSEWVLRKVFGML